MRKSVVFPPPYVNPGKRFCGGTGEFCVVARELETSEWKKARVTGCLVVKVFTSSGYENSIVEMRVQVRSKRCPECVPSGPSDVRLGPIGVLFTPL